MAIKVQAEDPQGSAPDEDQKAADQKASDEKILELARKRFRLAEEAENDQRIEELEDLRFRAGDQWPVEIKNQRTQDKRPCHTINRLPQFIQQITNEQRQNRPAAKIGPLDNDADADTAKVYQGLVRHIEHDSNADAAYDTAFDGAVGKGRGFWRLLTDYIDPTSFEQEILIKRILNSFSVYMDPSFKESDGSDMKWCFITEDMTEEDYRALYPDSDLTSLADWQSIGDKAPDWIRGKSVRLSEYFYIDFKEIDVVLLSDGHSMPKKDFEAMQSPKGITVKDERKSQVPTVKWCKINGMEILERRELPGSGKWIPVIPAFGNELDIDGKRIFEGIIRHAKDPQRQYNFWTSAQTEMIALAPRAPFIGYEGQFEGHEAEWETANIRNHAYLQVKPTTIAGQPAPLPQRNSYEAPVQAITASKMQSADDLKATTGIYDASLGNRSNEQSGIAIRNRTIQSQTGNFHFIDNLGRAIRHSTRIMVDWIPDVYDTARTIRIIGEDGQEEIVAINQMFEKNGQQKIHRMEIGKYGVDVEVGPSFATRRQEAEQSMLDLIKVYPQAGQFIGDLLVKNMDIPGAKEIAERLRKMLPPGIADDPNAKKMPVPPEVQQQMQKMGQMIDQLTQHLQQTTHVLETNKLELESRERIEMAKLEVQTKIAMVKLDSQEAMHGFEQEVAMIHKRLDMLNVNTPIGIDNGGEQPPAQPSTGGQQAPGQQPPTGGVPPGPSMGG